MPHRRPTDSPQTPSRLPRRSETLLPDVLLLLLLCSRLDAAWRAAQGSAQGSTQGSAQGPVAQVSPEQSCSWVGEAERLQLPDFPQLPSSWQLPPLPRLLPAWTELQGFADAVADGTQVADAGHGAADLSQRPLDATAAQSAERLERGASAQQQSPAYAQLLVGAAAGAAAMAVGGGIVLGLTMIRSRARNGNGNSRLQLRRTLPRADAATSTAS